MKRTTPAVTTTLCDACQREMGYGAGKAWSKMETTIHIKQHGLDYLGDPACDASRTLDLCDECAVKVNRLLISIEAEHKAKR